MIFFSLRDRCVFSLIIHEYNKVKRFLSQSRMDRLSHLHAIRQCDPSHVSCRNLAMSALEMIAVSITHRVSFAVY